jgi:hypothetical protein
MREFRLQCVETGRIWPRTYETQKGAIAAQGQWNSQAPAPAGTFKAARGERVGSTHPNVRVVEVEVTVVVVVREPLPPPG